MVQVISATEAAAMVKPGSRIAIGGFLAVGAPEILRCNGGNETNNLHMIVIASDWENRGVGKLIVNRMVTSAQVSHMGTNKTIPSQMNAREIEINLSPKGTLMERVRAFGAGLGVF
jgi:acyl CoA:acetate/3-ketoacid CoA transferase alpha subunit